MLRSVGQGHKLIQINAREMGVRLSTRYTVHDTFKNRPIPTPFIEFKEFDNRCCI